MDDNYLLGQALQSSPPICLIHIRWSDIYAGLSYLKNKGIIDCTGERGRDYTYRIRG